MPIVSVNLDQEAFDIYIRWRNRGRSASRKVSSAIKRHYKEVDTTGSLLPGDVRRCVTGELLVWNGEDFEELKE